MWPKSTNWTFALWYLFIIFHCIEYQTKKTLTKFLIELKSTTTTTNTLNPLHWPKWINVQCWHKEWHRAINHNYLVILFVQNHRTGWSSSLPSLEKSNCRHSNNSHVVEYNINLWHRIKFKCTCKFIPNKSFHLESHFPCTWHTTSQISHPVPYIQMFHNDCIRTLFHSIYSINRKLLISKKNNRKTFINI